MQEQYEIRDIWLASFLLCKGMKLLDIRKDQKPYIFVFKDCPQRPKLINKFVNGKAYAPARKLIDSYKYIKSWIFEY